MIEEQAVIARVEDNQAWVEGARKSACGGCAQQCATSLLNKYWGHRKIQLNVDANIALAPGDRVVIGIDERALVSGALWVYLLPLAALIGGALLGDWLARQMQGFHPEWGSVVVAALSFTLSLRALKKFPWFGRERLRPIVLRKVDH